MSILFHLNSNIATLKFKTFVPLAKGAPFVDVNVSF